MTQRQQLERAIAQAIDLLDTLDPDADLEPETAEEQHDAEPIDYAA